MAFGVLLRVVRYLMQYPLWGDEAFLAANFIERGYLDLLRPLEYGQVSPLFFLWVERAMVGLLGFSEWSLRLVPTLAGVASVFLFHHVSGRVPSDQPTYHADGWVVDAPPAEAEPKGKRASALDILLDGVEARVKSRSR